MSEWVDVRLDSIMSNTNGWNGGKIYGFAHYFERMIENQEKIIELLEKTLSVARYGQ